MHSLLQHCMLCMKQCTARFLFYGYSQYVPVLNAEYLNATPNQQHIVTTCQQLPGFQKVKEDMQNQRLIPEIRDSFKNKRKQGIHHCEEWLLKFPDGFQLFTTIPSVTTLSRPLCFNQLSPLLWKVAFLMLWRLSPEISTGIHNEAYSKLH